MTRSKHEHLPYISILRAIAILGVVTNHGVHGLQWGVEYGNFETSRAIKILFTNSVVPFVIISGFLFQHLLYKFNYRAYLTLRLKLVVLPYFIVSIPAILSWTLLYEKTSAGMPVGFYDQSWWYQVGFFYLTGEHMAPLWFVPMIVMFYFLSPLVRLIDRFPALYLSIPILVWLSYVQPRHVFPWVSFVHFFSLYIIGMAACRFRKQVLPLAYQLRYLFLMAFIVLVGYEWYALHTTQSFYGYLNKLCLSFYLIAIFDHCRDRQFRFLTWVAAISFGIYFLHTYVNAGLKILSTGGPGRPLDIIGNVFYQSIYTLVLIILSIIICLLIKKITGKYSKYVIGA